MAHPSHPSTSTPHTPRHVKPGDVSRNSMHRGTLPTPVFRRKATLLWLVFSILLFWCIGSFFRSTDQTDRIPFAHGPTEEQVIPIDFPSRNELTRLKLVRSCGGTSRLWNHIHRSLRSTRDLVSAYAAELIILSKPCTVTRLDEWRGPAWI